MTTDASDYALGAVLSQGHVGRDLPIAYASRVLNGAELRYSVIEKELLAIVFAVKMFRPYLYGRRFWLVTDHRPLTWLYQLKDPTLNSRLARWKIKLQEFEHEIVYKPGRVNANADALSRNPVPTVTKDENKVSFPEVENLSGMPQTAAGVFSCNFRPDPGKYFSEYPIERVFVSNCVREELKSSENKSAVDCFECESLSNKSLEKEETCDVREKRIADEVQHESLRFRHLTDRLLSVSNDLQTIPMTFRRVETIAEGGTRSKPYACVGTPEQKGKGSRDAKKRMIDEEGQIEDLRMVLERKRQKGPRIR